MADKMTKEELGALRRVELRSLAAKYDMDHNECSTSPSAKLIEYILAHQDGKKPAKGKAVEAAKPSAVRGRRGQVVEEPEEPEEADEGDEDADDEAPVVRGRGRAAAKVEEQPEDEKPRESVRGRRGQAAEQPSRAVRGSKPEDAESPEGDMALLFKRIDTIGKMLDELKKENKDLAKRAFVCNGLVQEVMVELKIPEKDIDAVINSLEDDFDQGKE